MIQTSGWGDAATYDSKVLVHIAEITSDDLRMTDGEGLISKDKQATGADIYISDISFLAV
jgi:hypothetical protein